MDRPELSDARKKEFRRPFGIDKSLNAPSREECLEAVRLGLHDDNLGLRNLKDLANMVRSYVQRGDHRLDHHTQQEILGYFNGVHDSWSFFRYIKFSGQSEKFRNATRLFLEYAQRNIAPEEANLRVNMGREVSPHTIPTGIESSSHSPSKKDIMRRSFEEFERSKESPKIALSDYETVHHHSIEHIPIEVLEACTKMNREIVEVNSRFEEAHARHLTKSKKEILRTATVALDRVPQGQPKKALLLGVGNGLDIPLQELAEKFDHLTVVELDRESTENAIKQLSSELQKKIRLVVADITGIAGEYCQELQKNINMPKLADFFKAAEKITNNVATKVTESTPDVGNDYAFACSHLVLSQLAGISHHYIQHAVESKFGVEISFRPDDVNANFLMSYQKLRESLQQEHIRYLAKSVTSLGAVHLADTYTLLEYSPLKQQPDQITLVSPSSIGPVMYEKFTLIKNAQWSFDHTPGAQKFLVMSHALEPKQGNTKE